MSMHRKALAISEGGLKRLDDLEAEKTVKILHSTPILLEF